MNGIIKRIHGKYYALRSYLEFRRHLLNWREVWSAYRAGREVPDLKIRRGNLTLFHDRASDDIINLWREIFSDATYTAHFYEAKPDDTVIDLGANIGTFALYLQSVAPGIHVHCFEPGAQTRTRLARNIKVNRLQALITIYPFAITGERGKLRMQSARLAAQVSLHASEFTSGIDGGDVVECITLDDVLNKVGAAQIDLLKMDIEGSEIDVLEKVSPIALKNVQRIVVEYHDRIRAGSRDRCEQALQRLGFSNIGHYLPYASYSGMGLLRAKRSSGD